MATTYPPTGVGGPAAAMHGKAAEHHAYKTGEHAQATTEETAKDISARLREGKDMAKEMLMGKGEVTAMGQQKLHGMKQMVDDQAAKVAGMAKRHPWLSTGLLLLAAFTIGIILPITGFSMGWMGKSLLHSKYSPYPGVEGNYGWPSGSMEAEAHRSLDKLLETYHGGRKPGMMSRWGSSIKESLGVGGRHEEYGGGGLLSSLMGRGTTEEETMMEKLFGKKPLGGYTQEHYSLLDKLMGKGTTSGQPGMWERTKDMFSSGGTGAYAGYKAKEMESQPGIFGSIKDKLTGHDVGKQHAEVDDVSEKLHKLLDEAKRQGRY